MNPPFTLQQKIAVSTALEEFLFDRPIKKREIEALKKRCELYQVGNPPDWTSDLLQAYSRYFGLGSALKIKSILGELEKFGYLKIWPQGVPQKIIDIGAGTFGASLGAMDFFREQEKVVPQLVGYDRDVLAANWARKEFKDFLPANIQLKNGFLADESLENTLLLSVDVLNEAGLTDHQWHLDVESEWIKTVESWCKKATESSLLVLVEPANKNINQNFLRLRDHLSQFAKVLLPCTHQCKCPAIEQREWCHEERNYKAPSAYWNLVHELGFNRNTLKFSMLVLGKRDSVFHNTSARIVSRQLKGKGKCEKWLCAQGKRWKAGILNRKQDETNQVFFDSLRGEVVDCHSTGLSIPE